MSAPFLRKQVTPFRPQCLMWYGNTFYAEPPLTTVWEQTGINQPNSHSGLLVCFFLPLHFAQHKAEGRQAALHEVLLLFLGELPLKYEQEENNNFIPKRNETYQRQQFLSHATVTAPHSSHPVSQENCELSVYGSMLRDKSCSSALYE